MERREANELEGEILVDDVADRDLDGSEVPGCRPDWSEAVKSELKCPALSLGVETVQ